MSRGGAWLIERNKRMARHRETSGGKISPEWATWSAIRRRCAPDAKPRDRRNYFERGIRVCDRWLVFENFLADMGRRPPGHSIDRIDNDGNYEPANCRWAPRKTQARNKSTNRLISWRGETRCVAEWAEVVGINHRTLQYRLRRGWPLDIALTAPASKNSWRFGWRGPHPLAKLTNQKVSEMKSMRSSGATFREIAEMFGVTTMTAFKAIKGETWRNA